MDIQNPKIEFEYTDSFGHVASMSASLESDVIDNLVHQFGVFLLSAGFSQSNIDECINDEGYWNQ